MPSDPIELAALQACSTLSGSESTDHRARFEQEVTALFDQFRDRLLRYLLTFGLGVPDAEEVVQEIFLSLFKHFLRRKSCEHPRGWLFRVAHNLALRRRQRNRPEAAGREELVEEAVIDSAPSPEDEVIHRQTQQRLLSVLHALPEQDRNCLTLRAEGLRYREIAEILDMSLGAVSLSLARSLGRIARSAKR